MIDHIEIPLGPWRLRPPHRADAARVLELGQDPDVRLWNPRVRIDDEATAVAECFHGADWSAGTHATFALADTEDRYLGTVSLYAIDRPNASALIGYRVMPAVRGRGAASSAVLALSAWAFTSLGLHRIALTHATANQASCRVALKCGYALEGVLRDAKRFGDGVLRDEHLHARLATDPLEPDQGSGPLEPLPLGSHP